MSHILACFDCRSQRHSSVCRCGVGFRTEKFGHGLWIVDCCPDFTSLAPIEYYLFFLRVFFLGGAKSLCLFSPLRYQLQNSTWEASGLTAARQHRIEGQMSIPFLLVLPKLLIIHRPLHCLDSPLICDQGSYMGLCGGLAVVSGLQIIRSPSCFPQSLRRWHLGHPCVACTPRNCDHLAGQKHTRTYLC